jgi:hypothetical protein
MDFIHISKLCMLHLAYSVSRPRNLYTTVLHWLGLDGSENENPSHYETAEFWVPLIS